MKRTLLLLACFLLQGCAALNQSSLSSFTLLIDNQNVQQIDVLASQAGSLPFVIARVAPISTTEQGLHESLFAGRYDLLLRPSQTTRSLSSEISPSFSDFDTHIVRGEPVFGALCLKLVIGVRLRLSHTKPCLQ